MRQIAILIAGAVFIAVLLIFSRATKNIPPRSSPPPTPVTIEGKGDQEVSIIAQGLNIPWEIAFDTDGNLYLTERAGRILILNKGKEKPIFLHLVSDVHHAGEGGLLGLTLHPQFANNGYLYVYYTYREGNQVFNKVLRLVKKGEKLTEPKIIIDRIPGGGNHDGGRIKFGPDGFLYITTGDAGRDELAQNKSSLAGKILRLKDDGSVPEDNPFVNPVYSWGHRNPQGLAWDSEGRLWSTEHGRSGLRSGFDELNLIEKGLNYGWPTFQGSEFQEGFEKPVLHSGPNVTWAPSGAVYFEGSIFFAGLRGQTLYEAKIKDSKIELKSHFQGVFGRIRTVVLGPDNFLYVLTSNLDGRGEPKEGDDKLIRLNPHQFKS